MNRLVIFFVFAAFFSCDKHVMSQEAELEVQLANDLNRLQTFFMLANNGINGSQDMEATEEQKVAFADLQAERELIQSQISVAVKEKDAALRLYKLEAIRESLDSLEEDLTNNVLLPHQIESLKKAEFSTYLRQFKGDFARVVENFYGKKFGMTAEQKKRWGKLREQQELKKQEANREYNRKLNEIEEETRSELGEIFTLKQIEMIEKLSGVSLRKKTDSK